MMSVLLLVLGALGLGRLGTDLFPDVSFPVVVTTVVYRGAGPAEIENQVVKPLEDAIAGISGVDFIHSWSRESVGLIVTQFSLSASLDRSVQEVRDKVSFVQSRLPREADVPQVSRLDIGATPVMSYAISGDMSSTALRKLIKDRVEPALAQIEGVAEVRIQGGDIREIRVDVDLDRSKSAGIAPIQVAERIGMDNLNIPGGTLQLGPTELSVRSLGQFKNVDDVRALPIAKSQTGAQVRLDEISTVTDGVAERRTLARLNGAESIVIDVVKQPGSNTVDVADAVRKKIDEIGPALGHGFKASVIIDQSGLIKANAEEVWIAIFFGGAMAILIILLFLLDVRGTLISALALPTSVVGTFFVMYVLNYTLNQMTLLALSLAIGLLIDDAVVVREAITHRLDKGESPFQAASHGTRDVGLAVLATTFSLISVFVPVAFMPGIVGQFFKQFGITISAAVTISLFISFTLDPMLSARFAKQREPGVAHQHTGVAGVLEGLFKSNERMYESMLRWVLGHKLLTAGLTFLVLIVSGISAMKVGAEFVAVEDRSQFMVDLKLGNGASLKETETRAMTAEQLIKRIPEVTDIYTLVGIQGDTNKARLRVLTVPKDKRKKGIGAIKEEARALLLPELPATDVALNDPPVIEGAGDFYPIMIRLIGPDLDKVQVEAEKVAGYLKAMGAQTADVRVEVNPPRPEVQVSIDRARAHDVDLTSAMLGTQVRLALNGQVAGKLREGFDETDIVVRLAEKDRASPEDIKRLDIFTPRGLRSVTDVANVETHDGPTIIERHNRERQIAVYSNLGKNAALGDVAAALREQVAKNPLPPGYSVVYDGQIKTFDEQNSAFALAFGLAFIFIYMVLGSQFESFKHPFTIMVSVPLALVGAVLALLVTGYHLSIGAMIGIILLMGLVTKNAILLVDGALQNIRAGDDVDTALLKAGPRRLRPILMTSAAMAIGMVPTAIGTGLGSEFRAPMAVAVIGGVITSTFLTLLVVPVVFAFFEMLTPKRWRIGKEEAALPALLLAGFVAFGVSTPVEAAESLAPQATSAAGPVVEPQVRRPASFAEVMKLARDKNPDLAAAKANASLAKIQAGRVFGSVLPEITAGGQLVRTSAPARFAIGDIIGLVGGVYRIPPQDLSLIPDPIDIVGVNSAYANVQISQLLFTPQMLLVPAAKQGTEAAQLGAMEAQEQILLNVAKLYLGLEGLRDIEKAARDAEGVALRREKDAQTQLSLGMSVEVSLLRAQSETAQARSVLAQIEGQKEALLSMLEALVGEPVQPLPGATQVSTGEAGTEAQSPWNQTYLVQSSAKAAAVADTFDTYSNWSFLPTLMAIAKGNYNSNAGFTGKNLTYDLILALNWSLYDRGNRYVELHENEAKAVAARSKLEGDRAKARAQWMGARANLVAAEAALKQAESQAALARRAQKSVESAFKAGLTTSLELSDVDNKRFFAESQAAQARTQFEVRKLEVAASEGRLTQALGLE